MFSELSGRRRPSVLRACALAAPLLLVWPTGLGCTATSGPSLRSSYAPDRARAIVRAAERREAGSIHHLVALLEDSDAAVRMYAILALERLTGETLGYRYFDAEWKRDAAVERWREAVRAGRIGLANRPAPSDSSASGPPAPQPDAHEGTARADASTGSVIP